MPQEMHVLCCYSCKIFQAHIVKKTNKWQCKICNEKQSVQRVHFQGSGSDCRINVQHLNASINSQSSVKLTSLSSSFNANTSVSNDSCCPLPHVGVSKCKWEKYLCPANGAMTSKSVPTDTVVKDHTQDNSASALIINPNHILSQETKEADHNIFESNEDFDVTVDF